VAIQRPAARGKRGAGANRDESPGLTVGDDWKMFAPLRRGEPVSIQAKVVAVLKTRAAGATVAALADELLQTGAAVGMRPSVRKRIGELLDQLEQDARVERIPDGRYRVVASRT
jgi:predicted aconitase with swiveling domain